MPLGFLLLKQPKSAASCFIQISGFWRHYRPCCAQPPSVQKAICWAATIWGNCLYVCHILVADNIHRVWLMVNTILMLNNISSKGAELLLSQCQMITSPHHQSIPCNDAPRRPSFSQCFPVDHGAVSALKLGGAELATSLSAWGNELIFCCVRNRAIWISAEASDSQPGPCVVHNNCSANARSPQLQQFIF